MIVPITAGKLDLGPWQRVFYGEWDGQRRKRVIIKVLGRLDRFHGQLGLHLAVFHRGGEGLNTRLLSQSPLGRRHAMRIGHHARGTDLATHWQEGDGAIRDRIPVGVLEDHLERLGERSSYRALRGRTGEAETRGAAGRPLAVTTSSFSIGDASTVRRCVPAALPRVQRP